MGVSAEHGHNTKQLSFQLHCQNSSSNQSCGQSHPEGASTKESNPYEKGMVSSHSESKEIQGKMVGGHIKPVSSMGTQAFVFPSSFDYSQAIARIPFQYAEPCFGGLLAAPYGPQAMDLLEKHKGLSLDPQRKHHYHHQQQHQNQDPVLNSRHVGEEERQREVNGGEGKGEDEEIQDSNSQKEHHFLLHQYNQHHIPQALQIHQQHPSYLQNLPLIHQGNQYLIKDHFLTGFDTQFHYPHPTKKRCSSTTIAFGEQRVEHARKMGENDHQASTSSRLGIKNTEGEIVEVQGGHIVRSIGRKDRHSKVCTAKGPRDRRVRLSAHTAIQFYDVQDRLGYDRPSKAVDWLIKKAKLSIDELAKLPAWVPTTMSNTATAPNSASNQRANEDNENPIGVLSSSASRRANPAVVSTVGGDSRVADSTRGINLQRLMVEHHSSNSSAFLPPSLDSDAIADTIRSFFPMGASNEPSSSTIEFNQSYPPDLISRTSSHSQDLRLSLQPIQEPILIQHHQAAVQTRQNEHAFFSGTTTQLGYDGSGWTENHPHQADSSRFQRMIAWNDGDTGNGGVDDGEGSGFMFNSLPTPSQSLQQPPLQPLFGQSQFFSQRGPLQSSNSSSVRAWIDPTFTDHQFSSTISGMGYAYGGFSGFHIPARIPGEEEHDGISDKPSTASSDSRH